MGPSRRVSSRTGSIGCACVDLGRVVAAVRCDSLRQSGWRVLVAPHDQVSVAVHWLVFDHSQAVHQIKNVLLQKRHLLSAGKDYQSLR